MEKELRSLIQDSKYFQLSQCYNEGTADTSHDRGVMYKATIDVVDIKFPGPIPDEERLRVMLVRSHIVQCTSFSSREVHVCLPFVERVLPFLIPFSRVYNVHMSSEHVCTFNVDMCVCVCVCLCVSRSTGNTDAN